MKLDFSVVSQAVKKSLSLLKTQEPLTASQWADQYFYLSAESSYIEGRWKTLAFQVAPLNAMGNDVIRQVDFIKSARVGFTKLLMANAAYKIEHKNRKLGFWQPTDNDAKEFCKQEIDTMIRDVPLLRKIFPDFDKKSPKNTIDLKQFIGSVIYIKGGKSGKNYRRISVDEALLDELDAFDADIETEGTPSGLAWKRTEGSSFRKMIRGTTPKIKGESQIEKAVEEAKAYFKYFVPCVHCGEFQDLRFGGRDTAFGLKWTDDDPSTVMYQCPHCAGIIANSDLPAISNKGYWLDEVRGVKTVDGITFFNRSGETIEAPSHIAFHVWTIYSPFTTWREIVTEWLDCKSDPLKLKTFVNTTLGETYDLNTGETVDGNKLKHRAEGFFTDPLPSKVCYITAGIDHQPDRFEVQVLGWGVGYECWVLDYKIIHCDTSLDISWHDVLHKELQVQYRHPSGKSLPISFSGIDTGGSATQVAYKYCKKFDGKGRLAMKGVAGQDKPIIPLRPSNAWKLKGLKGWNVGVDTAKMVVYQMLSIDMVGDRFVHFPDSGLPDDYYDQVTSERRLMKIDKMNRRKYYWWKPASKRNEALDTFVYALAALEHAGVDLSYLSEKLKQKGEKKIDDLLSEMAK
ncbi:MAG: phage terminase large subunit family protein [Arenicella sp.]